MILERGDMWSVFHETDVFMITTNPIIRKDGAVVMGRGIAYEAKTRYPELPYEFAEMYTKYPNNIGYIGEFDGTRVYWFMVKEHWAKDADPSIISKSVDEIIDMFGYSSERVDLNFPGIGNGKLSRREVLPILWKLPSNIHIWEKGVN